MKVILKLLASTFIATSAMLAATNASAFNYQQCKVGGTGSHPGCTTNWLNIQPGVKYAALFTITTGGPYYATAEASVETANGTLVYKRNITGAQGFNFGEYWTPTYTNTKSTHMNVRAKLKNFYSPGDGGARAWIQTM